MKLYDYVLSGNCYKIRLLAGFLGLEYESIGIDFFPGREHKSQEFLKINPLGQLPVLEDDGEVIRDAQAILVYLATRYDNSGKWWSKDDPIQTCRIMQWLSFADQITSTSSAARLHDVLGYELDVEAARSGAHNLFRALEDHLTTQGFSGHNWLTGGHPTIADIACFPYTALAEDGGIEIHIYPSIQNWIRNFAKLDNFQLMPGINIIR